MLNSSFVPDTAEVAGAYKQQRAGWDVEWDVLYLDLLINLIKA